MVKEGTPSMSILDSSGKTSAFFIIYVFPENYSASNISTVCMYFINTAFEYKCVRTFISVHCRFPKSRQTSTV